MTGTTINIPANINVGALKRYAIAVSDLSELIELIFIDARHFLNLSLQILQSLSRINIAG
jgi:hypothetical protein